MPNKSDVDLVAVFSVEAESPTARLNILRDLNLRIASLEADLLPVLEWEDATAPITSVVTLTQQELSLNVHKSGVADFFTVNKFLRLLAPEDSPKALVVSSEKDNRTQHEAMFQILEACQGYRNEYLSVSANGRRKVDDWDDVDPIPKTIARYSAQLRYALCRLENETKFDVNLGNAFVLQSLARESSRRDEKPIHDLHDWLLVRMGGRGERLPLSPDQHVLLLEILNDIALEGIRYASVSPNENDLDSSHEEENIAPMKGGVVIVAPSGDEDELRKDEYLGACENEELLIEYCRDLLAVDDYQIGLAKLLREGEVKSDLINRALGNFADIFARKHLRPLFELGCLLYDHMEIAHEVFRKIVSKGITLSELDSLCVYVPNTASNRLCRIFFNSFYELKSNSLSFEFALRSSAFARYCTRIDSERMLEILKNWRNSDSFSSANIGDAVSCIVRLVDQSESTGDVRSIMYELRRWRREGILDEVLEHDDSMQNNIIRVLDRL